MTELKKIRVRDAKARDVGLFRKLWKEFLTEQNKNGSVIKDSDKNVEVYANLFRMYADKDIPEEVQRNGVVLFISEVAVLMAGDAGNDIEITTGRRPAMIWGVYVTPDHRGKGLGAKLIEEALNRLRDFEFDAVFGNAAQDGNTDFEKFVGSTSVISSQAVYAELNEVKAQQE